jgi:hypothetical protein
MLAEEKGMAKIKVGILACLSVVTVTLCCISVLSTSQSTSRSRAIGQAQLTNQWMIEATPAANLVHLTLHRRPAGNGYNRTSLSLPLAQLQGLTQGQVFSNGTNVQFRLVRGAGALICAGWLKDGKGIGEWTFMSNPDFISGLSRLGYGNLSNDELEMMAVSDVSVEFIRQLSGVGYRNLPVKDLLALSSNGITADLIKAYHVLINNDITVGQFIALRSNEVTPAYIQSLRALGCDDLTVKQLISLRTNGVTPDFIEKVRTRGYQNLSTKELINLRQRGVRP